MDKAIYHLKDQMEKGKNVVVAEVVDSAGSTPRKKGAWLMMTESGERYGTVGGGRLEAETEALCRAAFETKKGRLVTFTLDREAQQGLDMRCGGDVSVRIAWLTPPMIAEFLAGIHAGTTAYLFGGGHVGLALEHVLRYVGFDTVVLDDRAEYASHERFPEAADVRVLPDYQHAFDGFATDETSYLVIVTRGHAGDYDVLRQALKAPHAYIGMIGSRKKVAETMRALRAEGFSDEALAAVHSPIGLAIGAETPEEIAVSVAAEMIAVRAGKQR